MKRLAVHYDIIHSKVEYFLSARRARIEAERRALIEKEMAGHTKWFGLVKVGPFTEEEAIKRLKKEEGDIFFSNRWMSIEYSGASWEDRAYKLLKACDLAYKNKTQRGGDGHIYLDDIDIELVRGEVAP